MDALYKLRKRPRAETTLTSCGLMVSRPVVLTGNPLEGRLECIYFVRIMLRRERTFLDTSTQHNI
jgi:hypothetical protein